MHTVMAETFLKKETYCDSPFFILFCLAPALSLNTKIYILSLFFPFSSGGADADRGSGVVHRVLGANLSAQRSAVLQARSKH